MKTFRVNIRTKIFLVILLPSLLMVFVLLLDYRNLGTLSLSAENILAKNYKSIQAAQEVRSRLESYRNEILMDSFSRGDDFPFVQETDITRQHISVLKNNITEIGESSLVEELIVQYERYEKLVGTLLAGADHQNNREELYQDFFSSTALLISIIDRLVKINEMAMERADLETKELALKARTQSVGILIIAILIIFFLSYLLSSKLSKPLKVLAQNLSSARDGSGHYPRSPAFSSDEIGFLAGEFNRLFERLEQYEQTTSDELMAQKLKVLQAEQSKARFIEDLSHQLKTPMTSLSMGIGLLSERLGQLHPDRVNTLVETAREDCRRLSTLINELVDVAKLDATVKPPTMEYLDLEELIEECLRPLAQQASQEGIALVMNTQKDLPPLLVDSLKFPWVITNLVGNSLRYTGRGGRIVVSVTKEGSRYFFSCSDNGSGIEAGVLPRIFDRYSQFSERGKRGQVGLGLAMVKEIIQQHGGNIEVRSELGRGSTFTFWIPKTEKRRDEKNPAY